MFKENKTTTLLFVRVFTMKENKHSHSHNGPFRGESVMSVIHITYINTMNGDSTSSKFISLLEFGENPVS